MHSRLICLYDQAILKIYWAKIFLESLIVAKISLNTFIQKVGNHIDQSLVRVYQYSCITAKCSRHKQSIYRTNLRLNHHMAIIRISQRLIWACHFVALNDTLGMEYECHISSNPLQSLWTEFVSQVGHIVSW